MRQSLAVFVTTLIIITNINAKTHPSCKKNRTVLLIGDSISSGYGIAKKDSWVNLLRMQLARFYPKVKLINDSVAGSTSYNGLVRLRHQFQSIQPYAVMIELGGNDALRGLNLQVSKQNFSKMINLAKQHNSHILLISVRLFPNYGPIYTQAFNALYSNLAHEHNITFVPTLLKGIALKPSFMQADGIHPNTQAQPLILQRVWPSLKVILNQGC